MTEKKDITIWIKRIVSLLSIAYGALMVFLAYTSLYYDIQITHPKSFIALVVFLALLFGGVMIYTRKQFVTSVVGLFGLLLYLPIVILFYSKDNLVLLIPIGLVAVLIFFFSGAGEGLKTIIGTVYLLLYVICILAYYLYVSIFSGHTVDVVTQRAVSVTGAYRCYVLDITDNTSIGTTKVVVEPNDKDLEYSSVKFIEKGYERIVFNVRQNNIDLNLEWTNDDENTDLLKVNGEVRFKSSDAERTDDKTVYDFFSTKKRSFKFFK